MEEDVYLDLFSLDYSLFDWAETIFISDGWLGNITLKNFAIASEDGIVYLDYSLGGEADYAINESAGAYELTPEGEEVLAKRIKQVCTEKESLSDLARDLGVQVEHSIGEGGVLRPGTESEEVPDT